MITFQLTPVRVLGDANGDGYVDDTDASTLAAHWQQSADVNWATGDFNMDGLVDDADAAILAAHWNEGAPPTQVPEPAGAILLVGALVTFGLLRTRRLPGKAREPAFLRPGR